jgi:hypothetical protein
MSRVRPTTHSPIRQCYQRRRKCGAVTPECSRPQQGGWFIGQTGLVLPDVTFAPQADLYVRFGKKR